MTLKTKRRALEKLRKEAAKCACMCHMPHKEADPHAGLPCYCKLKIR